MRLLADSPARLRLDVIAMAKRHGERLSACFYIQLAARWSATTSRSDRCRCAPGRGGPAR
jgi:hypothetical protein